MADLPLGKGAQGVIQAASGNGEKTLPLGGVQQAIPRITREFKEKAIAEEAAKKGLGYVNLSVTPINPDLLAMLTPEEAKTAMLMPFFRIGKKVRVAVVSPERPETKAIINKFKEDGYALNINLMSEESLLDGLSMYEKAQYQAKREEELMIHEEDLQAYEKEIETLSQLRGKIGTMTSEDALNFINVGAIKTGASDIHFQPEEKFVRVRFRIDGVLQNIFDLDHAAFAYIANQLKYKAKLKLNIITEPQDGRYSFRVSGRKIDVRVSAVPTEFGESFVCRLLDSGRKMLRFEDLGFMGAHLEMLRVASQLAQGMVLITGPTGSGKTTTLYSLLTVYNKPEKKIITLEDPIEYHLENVTQSQINEKRGYTFASGLRSILRQDPDVIMIGEIRDLETAETASQAALTGHVLLSTLHTSSAIETIPRLVNMGLPHFMVGPTLQTVVAQRLVRRICPDCRKEESLTQVEREELIKAVAAMQPLHAQFSDLHVPDMLPKAPGCERCSHTGYRGQLVISEMLTVTDSLRDMILNKVSTHAMFEELRRNGFVTLREDGIWKVLQGITTLAEVQRVTNIL